MKYQVKKIKNFPKYKIDTNGTIWSFHKKEWQQLKGHKKVDGYIVVALCKKGERNYKLVHVLVLETFVGPRPKFYHGCHNNGVPFDNRLENLRWDTVKSNADDRKKHGTNIYAQGETHINAKLKDSDIPLIRELLKNSNMIQTRIAEIFKVSSYTISRINNSQAWKHVQ